MSADKARAEGFAAALDAVVAWGVLRYSNSARMTTLLSDIGQGRVVDRAKDEECPRAPVVHGATTALEQAAEALRECADRVDGLYSIGCEAVCSTSTSEETDRLIAKADAIIDRAHVALARIEAEPKAPMVGDGDVAEAEARGYAAGVDASVVALRNAIPSALSPSSASPYTTAERRIDVMREAARIVQAVGAAARAKEKR